MAIGQPVAKTSPHLTCVQVSSSLQVAQGCQESVLLMLQAAVMSQGSSDCVPPIASSTRQFLRTALEVSRQPSHLLVQCDGMNTTRYTRADTYLQSAYCGSDSQWFRYTKLVRCRICPVYTKMVNDIFHSRHRYDMRETGAIYMSRYVCFGVGSNDYTSRVDAH